MAFSDWVQNQSANPVIALDTTSPIVGSGSLSITVPLSGARQCAHLYLDAPFSKGFLKGRIRTLLRWDTGGLLASGAQREGAGIVGVQSQLDVSGTTGSCYSCYLGKKDVAGSAFKIVLGKHTAGLSSTVGNTYLSDTSLGITPTAGDFWPFEFEWVVDIPGLGGVRLIGRLGTKNSQDFGTLVDQFDLVDSSSPLSASVAEGVFAGKGNTAVTTNDDWSFDQTTVFELV